MPYTLILGGFLAALVLGGPRQAGAQQAQPAKGKEQPIEWKEYTSKQFGFKATFPGTAKKEQLRDRQNREFYRVGVIRNEDFYFTVSCMLGPDYLDKQQAKEYLAASATRTSEGKYYKRRKEIELGDVPGSEIESGFVRDDGLRMDTWYRNDRTGRLDYIVRVSGPRGQLDPTMASIFFESFELLRPGKNTPGIDELPAKGVRLYDAFAARNGTQLFSHWMNVGPGWEHFGTGEWKIYDKGAIISKRAGQDIYAADAGAADGILTGKMRTPDSRVEGMDSGLVVRLVDGDNYWLVVFHHDLVAITKKAGGAYKEYVLNTWQFKPKTIYQMKVTVQGDALTAFVNGKQAAEVKMDAHQKATKFGLRDNSMEKSQPLWSDFKVVSP